MFIGSFNDRFLTASFTWRRTVTRVNYEMQTTEVGPAHYLQPLRKTTQNCFSQKTVSGPRFETGTCTE